MSKVLLIYFHNVIWICITPTSLAATAYANECENKIYKAYWNQKIYVKILSSISAQKRFTDRMWKDCWQLHALDLQKSLIHSFLDGIVNQNCFMILDLTLNLNF